MNFKLINLDNFRKKFVGINPANIKKISLDYEITKCGMEKSKLDTIRTNIGVSIYETILESIEHINYKWEDGYYNTYLEKNEQEKAHAIYMLILTLRAIGSRGVKNLLRVIKENKENPENNDKLKIDDEIKTNIIYPLGQQEILNIFKRFEIDENSANIKSIDFLLKIDDIVIKYSINPYCNLIENSRIIYKLEDELKEVQKFFLEDFLKKLSSPNIAEVITPNWEILEEAVKKASS